MNTSAGVQSIGVVIIDDDALVRARLALILGGAADIVIVGEAGDGAEGVEVVRRCTPQVVLMDIRMPRLNGVEATRRLMSLHTPPRVLVLTTFDADEYVVRALAAGASGFLLKDTPPEAIVDAVRRIAAGSRRWGGRCVLLAPGEELSRRLFSASSDTLCALSWRGDRLRP